MNSGMGDAMPTASAGCLVLGAVLGVLGCWKAIEIVIWIVRNVRVVVG